MLETYGKHDFVLACFGPFTSLFHICCASSTDLWLITSILICIRILENVCTYLERLRSGAGIPVGVPGASAERLGSVSGVFRERPESSRGERLGNVREASEERRGSVQGASRERPRT